jgi:transcription antitermination factor NusG
MPTTETAGLSTVLEVPEACGRYPLPWHCVWTKPNQERLADNELRIAGFPTYLPLHMHIKADRSGSIQPLFPRYMFAQPTEDGQWVKMLFQRGIAGVLRNSHGTPKTVPSEAVEALLSQCAPNRVIYPPEPRTLLAARPGRITTGPFAEFTGICSRTTSDRVWLLLNMLGSEREVGFARNAVEAA